jgi:hypothetical protein
MFNLAFVVTNMGTEACSIPAEAALVLLAPHGTPPALTGGSGTVPQSGYFELQPNALNRAVLITSIDNWCGHPTQPSEAQIAMGSVGTVITHMDLPPPDFEGIACYDPTQPPGVVSPVLLVVIPNMSLGQSAPRSKRSVTHRGC